MIWRSLWRTIYIIQLILEPWMMDVVISIQNIGHYCFKRRLDGVLDSRLLTTILVLMIGYLGHIFEWQFCILYFESYLRMLILILWHIFEWYPYFCVIFWNAIFLCIVVTYFRMLNMTCDCCPLFISCLTLYGCI